MCKFLILFLHLTILHQSTLCKEIAATHSVAETKHLHDEDGHNSLMLTENYLDKRTINDMWISVKQTAKNIWSSIKGLAVDTKEKIKSWIEHVQKKANRILEALGERLETLKTKIVTIIHNIFGDGEIIKECLLKQNEKLNKLLKEIVKDVTKCIGDKINRLCNLEKYQFVLNDTEFVGKVEEKVKVCMEKGEHVDECILSVRKEMTEDSNVMENVILKHRVESRSKTDDILEAIVTCSTEGLIDATVVITTQVLDIINCVIEGSLAHYL